MHRHPLMLNFVPVLMALVLGCAEKPVEHTVKKVPSDTSDEFNQAKAEFEGMLKGKLEKLEAEIRELKRKAEKLEDTAKAEWNEKVAELDAKQKAAREKLDEVAKSTGEAWEKFEEGAKKAWEELEQAVRKARAE